MGLRLAHRRALITGAAGGIGQATARLFVEEGAAVGLIDRDADELGRTRDRLRGLRADAVVETACADIADAAATAAAIDAIAAALGGLDILVNNAAAREYGRVAEATVESWMRILATNVTGTAACTKAALPWLRRGGAGAIVNVSSVFAVAGRENMGQYDTTKAALLALTRVLACEEARHGIRVNAVCPGSTLTPWTIGRADARGLSRHELEAHGATPALLGRWAQPEEIAYPILWLASAEASFVTGAVLPVDGGVAAVAPGTVVQAASGTAPSGAPAPASP